MPQLRNHKNYKNYSNEVILATVNVSKSMAHFLRSLGLSTSGSNYVSMKQTLQHMGANTDHWKTPIENNNIVIQHFRDENKTPFGTFVAKKMDGVVRMAFSKCREGDKFNKSLGVKIALGRLEKTSDIVNVKLPADMMDAEADFETRCAKYFGMKDTEIPFYCYEDTPDHVIERLDEVILDDMEFSKQ